MTNHVGRLYSLALALLVFFVLWVGIAAHPWATAKTDPRLAALVVREQHLRHDGVLVKKIVAARWAVYRVHLAERNKAIAAAAARQTQVNARAAAVQPPAAMLASSSSSSPVVQGPVAQSPAVQIVNLPPLTITRTS